MAPSKLNLYNTLSRQVEPVNPLEEAFLIYTCGQTVYDDAHIGNFRTYIFEDILVKTLRYFGYQVKRVMNITDVGHLTSDADEGDDKLEVGAQREGKSAWEVAKYYEERFLSDLKAFNIEVPTDLVRATDTIGAQIEFIQQLEKKGYTYKLADGIYFESSKVADYGKLARLDIAGLQAGARVEMQEGKHKPTDFALWKFSPPDKKRDMEWDSPWGKGFPGWHIECSAIIRETLGDQIDIHCGGIDHIPVHHTNEIAQTEALTGKPLASTWCHGEFLLIDGGKMGKSLGNTYTLEDLKKRGFDPLAFRLFTYSANYRSKLNFTWEELEHAAANLQKLRLLVNALPATDIEADPVDLESFNQALADDLNMPVALAGLWELLRSDLEPARKHAAIQAIESIFSLDLHRIEDVTIPQEVQHLVDAREQARKAEDWATADTLRIKIQEAGFQVEDHESGPHIQPVQNS